MLLYKPGDSWSAQFITANSSGVATNADSTPTVKVYRNGTDDSANWSLSAVTNPATGQYSVSGTVNASAAAGDRIEVIASATMAAATHLILVQQFRLVQFGVTSLPAAASGSAGAVLTAGTGTGQLNVSAGFADANVAKVSGSPIPTPNVAGVPIVDIGYSDGSLVTNFDGVAQSGGTNTIKLANTASTTSNIYNNRKLTIVGGTGAGQSAIILSYDGPSVTATMDRNWTTLPDSSSQYVLETTANALLSLTQQDALVNELLDLADTMESGETLRQTLRLMRSVLVGTSTESSGTIVFKRRDGTTTALTVIHDTTGSRSSSTVGTV